MTRGDARAQRRSKRSVWLRRRGTLGLRHAKAGDVRVRRKAGTHASSLTRAELVGEQAELATQRFARLHDTKPPQRKQ
eukprot:4842815-Pleurochrysis_carterae.AAC.1